MKRISTYFLFLCCSLMAVAAPPRNGVGHCPLQNIPVPARWIQTPSGIKRLAPARTSIPRVLVIMANFANYSFVSPKADVDSLFNAANWAKDGATGSIRKYFYDQSQGQYNPQFDVVGPVTLSQNYAYYGANSGSNQSLRAGHMVTEACALVNDSVDFAQYDSNNDGKVDLVFVVYAGFGENDPPNPTFFDITASNLVWPHYSTISAAGCGTNQKVFDGKTIEAYECANELDGYYSNDSVSVPSGIGVYVHEFCHGLGLPDMYNTSNKKLHKTLGYWSVMDYGPYANDMHTPPSLNAHERWYMGWYEPEQLLEAKNDTLHAMSEEPDARYFTPTGISIPNILSPSTNIFYMLENRQKTGWDIGMPGSGLLLYKIHFNARVWSANVVNNDTTDMGVDILEADGISSPKFGAKFYGKQGDCYPYQSLDSICVVPDLPITDIKAEADGTITYKVLGGAIEPGPTTLLETTSGVVPAQKFFYRGNLYIRRGNRIYDSLGRLVE